jgi:hypothetical protein
MKFFLKFSAGVTAKKYIHEIHPWSSTASYNDPNMAVTEFWKQSETFGDKSVNTTITKDSI